MVVDTQPTMSIKQSTHRLLRAEYPSVTDLYAVPKEWDIDKIFIQYRRVYYDGVFQEVAIREGEVDMKYPDEIQFDEEDDLDQYFDCEDEIK